MASLACAAAAAPSSSANLGSGFDVLAIAHALYYDVVETCVEEAESGVREIELEGLEGPYAGESGGASTAVRAVESLLASLDIDGVKVSLTTRKGIPPGRGLGSSGASAAAAVKALVKALERLWGRPLGLTLEDLVEHAGMGEEAAAGTPHYDNVAASLLGGVVIVARSWGRLAVYRVEPPERLHLAFAIPAMTPGPGKTRAMRGILPGELSLGDAAAYAGRAAFLAAALARGDLEAAGKAMMMDDLVEPRRAGLLPCYEDVVSAAIKAGAYGASLSGAGPSIVALCPDQATARRAAEAMAAAYSRGCWKAFPAVAAADPAGARILWVRGR